MTFPESELRFLIKRGLQQLSRSLLRDLAGTAEKRDAALEMAVDIMVVRFHRLSIQAPDPLTAPQGASGER
ncbi:hypothetical protein [Sphingosinicella terrae]|uniref:hypothetical protein n=1 Tax=Sphingosinicella terrae TaxID=2172047 RepID=UPI000E0D812A|nr:hypothetical protein [Sphingosinicella terrae]